VAVIQRNSNRPELVGPNSANIDTKPRGVLGETIRKMEKLLGASGANLGLYSGYSYNPLA
jgi:hypothetical protein